MRQFVSDIVLKSARSVLPDTIVVVTPDTVLFDMDNGTLDSMGIVELTVAIEEHLDRAGDSVSLSARDAMSRKQSPYKTIGTLTQWVEELVTASKLTDNSIKEA